jgi:hypothetical protein
MHREPAGGDPTIEEQLLPLYSREELDEKHGAAQPARRLMYFHRWPPG